MAEEKVEDAEVVTEEQEAAEKQETFGKILILRQNKSGEYIDSGTEFDVLDEAGHVAPAQALGFIKAFSAAKLPDGRTLVVTAHLQNGETLNEIYSAGSSEEYDEKMGIDFCKGKIIHRVFKLLENVFAMANCTIDEVNKKVENAVKNSEEVVNEKENK